MPTYSALTTLPSREPAEALAEAMETAGESAETAAGEGEAPPDDEADAD